MNENFERWNNVERNLFTILVNIIVAFIEEKDRFYTEGEIFLFRRKLLYSLSSLNGTRLKGMYYVKCDDFASINLT